MKYLSLVLAVLLPVAAYATDPTPTPTGTPYVRQIGTHGSDTTEAYISAEVKVLPTQVPTAYSTPQVANAQPIKFYHIVNGLNCAIVLDMSESGADNITIAAGASLDLDFGSLSFHHGKGINVRGNAACSTGVLTIDRIF